MPYAEVADVRARAGVVAPAFNGPNLGDAELQRFIDDAASQIDAAVAALGIALPIVDTVVTGALRELNACGALCAAIPAKFPAGEQNDQVATLYKRCYGVWDGAMNPMSGSIVNGTLVAIKVLLSGQPTLGASDFWSRNADYGLPWSGWDRPDIHNPYLAPGVARTDRF